MKMLQIEIKDKYRNWGAFDILEIGWNYYNHKIEWVKIDWFKQPGRDLLFMRSDNFNENFANIYGNLFGKIIN